MINQPDYDFRKKRHCTNNYLFRFNNKIRLTPKIRSKKVE